MLLLIDNYDSFTYNLAQAFSVLGTPPLVLRHDKVSIDEIASMKPTRIVISPGPGTPDSAGVSCETIRQFSQTIPMLGICLGHQCIAQVFGGSVVQSEAPTHGKTSTMSHNRKRLFEGLEDPFVAMRYHSLIVSKENFPDTLAITAETKDGVIMALEHRTLPIFGVQFHPESVLTHEGTKLLHNFLRITERSVDDPNW